MNLFYTSFLSLSPRTISHSFPHVGRSKKKTIGNSLYFPRKRQWFSFFLYVIFASFSFYNLSSFLHAIPFVLFSFFLLWWTTIPHPLPLWSSTILDFAVSNVFVVKSNQIASVVVVVIILNDDDDNKWYCVFFLLLYPFFVSYSPLNFTLHRSIRTSMIVLFYFLSNLFYRKFHNLFENYFGRRLRFRTKALHAPRDKNKMKVLDCY